MKKVLLFLGAALLAIGLTACIGSPYGLTREVSYEGVSWRANPDWGDSYDDTYSGGRSFDYDISNTTHDAAIALFVTVQDSEDFSVDNQLEDSKEMWANNGVGFDYEKIETGMVNGFDLSVYKETYTFTDGIRYSYQAFIRGPEAVVVSIDYEDPNFNLDLLRAVLNTIRFS